MRKIGFAIIGASVLSLLSCQAPAPLVSDSPRAALSKSSFQYISSNNRTGNQGLDLTCEPNGREVCRLSELLKKDPTRFKAVFDSGLQTKSISTVAAFQLLFLAMLEHDQTSMNFILNKGLSISRQDLRELEDLNFFYLPGNTDNIVEAAKFGDASVAKFKQVPLDMLRLLIEAVSPDARQSFLEDIAFFAAASGHLPALRFLAEQGADFQEARIGRLTSNVEPETPLYYAITFWEPEATRFFSKQGLRLKTSQFQSPPSSKEYQLIQAMAKRPHKQVRQMLEVLLLEPILDGNRSLDSRLKSELLSVAAGYEQGHIDLEGMRYLISAGAKATVNGGQYARDVNIPGALNVLIQQKLPLAEKEQAFSLLLQTEPEVQLRSAVFRKTPEDLAIVDFLMTQLSASSQAQVQLKRIKSDLAFSIAAGSPPEGPGCDQKIQQLLNQGDSFPQNSDFLSIAILNRSCSDQMVLKLAQQGANQTWQSLSSETAQTLIARWRPQLLPAFLELPDALTHPQNNLNKLLVSLLNSENPDQKSENPDQILKMSQYLLAHFPKERPYLSGQVLSMAVNFSCRGTQASNVSYLQVLRELLAEQKEINHFSDTDSTPLRAALEPRHNCLTELGLLIEKGADVNVRFSGDSTPLMAAESLPVIKVLVEHGADINAIQRTDNSYTTVRSEVRAGIALPKSVYSSVMLRAIGSGDRELIQYLLSKQPEISSPYRSDWLYSSISGAIGHLPRSESTALLELILSQVTPEQRKVLLQDELLLYTIPLFSSADPANHGIQGVAVVKFLLEQGLNPNVTNNNLETPLILAAKHRFEQMYQVLLQAGANPKAKDIWGNSAESIHARNPVASGSTLVPQPTSSASLL